MATNKQDGYLGMVRCVDIQPTVGGGQKVLIFRITKQEIGFTAILRISDEEASRFTVNEEYEMCLTAKRK